MDANPLIYAICVTSRSGSTWLCQLLGEHGRLGKPDEFLTATGIPKYKALFHLPPDTPLRDYFAKLLEQMTLGGVFGVKVASLAMLHHVVRFSPEFPRLIFLRRDDVDAQARSLFLAESRGNWDDRYSQRPELSVPAGSIRKTANRIRRANQRWNAYFAEQGVEPLRLVYEDVCADPDAAVAKVAEFLREPK